MNAALADIMRQREFDRRVKGGPKPAGAPRGRIFSSALMEVALVLFCAAFAIELLTDGARMHALHERGASAAQPEHAAGVGAVPPAFGAKAMHSARGVVNKTARGAEVPVLKSIGLRAEAFFAQAWAAAILRMRTVFDAGSQSGLRGVLNGPLDLIARMVRTINAEVESLLPSLSETPAAAIGLDSNLPMLASVGAFTALILLCFIASVFVTVKVARTARARGFRVGSRRL
ncbi:MAG TPA: hypothetical protein VMV27_07915 [Candidatus Binataceae bacterium]|nr:hypothetical protein [Candidatus Binataceae bacterium]